MIIKCIAIDDEPLALMVLENLCKKVPEIKLKRTFTKLSSAKMYINEFPVDLIFLDIKMPHQTGIDFYKSLEKDVLVVFTTAYPNYAIQGFEVNALDYLLKPINFPRFKEACQRALSCLKSNLDNINSDEIYVRSEYTLVKIELSKITYIETMDDYIKIYQKEQKTVITLMSLKKIMNLLPESRFCRVHRSFIVSLSEVLSLRGNMIYLKSIKIPIGGRYKKEVLKKIF